MASMSTSSISELYQSYKEATKCFLTWLWCQYRLEASRDDAGDNKFRSTADILRAAKIFRQSKAAVPRSVLSFLRKAIEQRKLVANVYHQLDAGDHGHNGFISRLEEVLAILTPLLEKMPVSSNDAPLLEKMPVSSNDALEEIVPLNTFSHLSIMDTDSNDQESSTPGSHEHRSPLQSSETTSSSGTPTVPSDFWLEDDYIREVFDAAYFLIELDSVHSQIKNCWTDAARGNIPLPLAAWMTNLAIYTIARDLPPKFVHVCVNTFINPEFVCEFFSKLSNKVDPAMFISDARRFLMLAEAINDYGETLSGTPKSTVTGRNFLCDRPNCACKFKTSYGFRSHRNFEEQELSLSCSESERSNIRTIFDVVRDDLGATRAISLLEATKPLKCGCFTPICESFFFVARDFLSQSVPLASARLVVALTIFFLTDESILVSDAKIKRSEYRLQALRLAFEIRSSILPVMDAVRAMAPNCERAQYWHRELQELLDGVNAYVSQKKFDIYHTSPWTAGSHMMELLTAAFTFGFRINSDWAVISATLHLYNAMHRSVADTPRIPVLDELSEVLTESIFGGSLPERNFCSTFRRIVYQSKIDNSTTSPGGGKVFRLQAGMMRLPQLLHIDCSLIDQHFGNHNNCEFFQGEVLGIRHQPGLGQRSSRKIKETRAKLSTSEYMEKAKARGLQDLEGPKPFARINLFAVFTLCSTFLNRFGSLGRQHIPTDKFESSYARNQLKNDLVVGRCEAEMLMQSIDESSIGRQGRRHLARMSATRNAILAYNEMESGATLKQYLWEF